MSRILSFLILIIIFTFASACSSAPPTPQENPEEEPSATPIQESISASTPGYPAQVVAAPAFDPGYPAPTEQELTPTPIPTQDETKGSIRGRLLLNNQPVSDVILSLGEVIRDSSGNEMVVSYDPTSSPTSVTDPDGNIIFVNVLPGKYGLILDTVIKSYLLHYPEEEDTQILVTVEQGVDFDLGDLNYDTLPIQSP